MKPAIQVFKDKSGTKDVLQINNAAIYSAYDIDRLIERQLKNLITKTTRTVVCFGAGLGYHQNYLNRNRPDLKVLSFEIIPEVFNLLNSKNKSGNSNVFFYSNPEELMFLFEKNIDYKNLEGIKIFNAYQPVNDFKNKFIEFINVLKTVIESKHKNFWTQYCLSELWNENISINFKHIEASYPVNSIYGKFKNIPALIVCAGPSLDKSLKDIKIIKDKCVVIAVDTALRSLLNQNCIPDIVVSLDAQKENFNDFKGIDIQDFILVYDLTINPKILDWYKGERKLCSIIGQHLKTCEGADYVKFEPLFDYIKDSIGDTGYLQTGGSVSTIALDLARNMECDPIIFSGQDLAYTGLKTHSADSYDMLAYASSQTKFHTFETNLFSYYSNKSLFPVKGNFSETVYTDTTLKHYQNWISDAAKIMKQKIFNATEGGAYIPNTEKKTLSELSEALPVINKNILNRINQNKKIKINRDILSMKIKTDLDFLDKSLKRVKLAIQELKHGKSIFESLADFKKLKEIILENNYSFLDLYKNKYYVMLKQLYSLNLEEAAFEKNDLELFFLNMEYGLEKIPSFLKRIIE